MSTTQLPSTLPNLTETQARQTIAVMRADMDAAPKPLPVKTRDRIEKNMLRDWVAGDPSIKFLLYARYYGKANYAGRGLAR